jgi:hypothetical protein
MKDKIRNISNFYFKNFQAIIYNICSLCFIIINTLIPLYTNEIIYFNCIIIENITNNYKHENDKKINNFNMFMSNLVDKNKAIITKIRMIQDENENINNYLLEKNNEYSSNSYSDSDSDSDSNYDYNGIIESSSSDILCDKIKYNSILEKTNSNNSIPEMFFKFDTEYKKKI